MKLVIFLIITILTVAFTSSANKTSLVWPKPTSFSYDPQGLNLTVGPCDVKFAIQSFGENSGSVDLIINQYLMKNYNCHQQIDGKHTLKIVVKNLKQLTSTDLKHERYELHLLDKDNWHLRSDYYVGFVRGLETFFQLFERHQKSHIVRGLPIVIEDGPEFLWRGLMIDTSRHFLPVPTIEKIIRSMGYAKLNVLHWHIVDEDSFPMIIPSVPELSQSGQIGGVYTPNEVDGLIVYANIYGISVVFQVDTPAHTQSWGRSNKYKDITLTCNGKYMGQLDPSLDLTWQVLTDVLKHLKSISLTDYVHLGGDEVVYDCWNTSNINSYMQKKNISDYFGLSVDFRQREKKLWHSISSKKVIYWANEDIDLPLENDDIIQWWGVSTNVDRMAGRINPVILSNYDLTYLDIGFNNIYGDNYGVFQNWRTMYSFQPRIKDVNVIGGESCMWNEIGTRHTFEQKVLLRANVIGERLWNDNIDIKTELNNVATRLTAQAARLRQRGFKVWPVTVGICQKDMSLCF